MPKLLLPRGALVFALAIPAAAQDVAFEPRPEGTLLHIAFDGPARLAERFAPTKLHALCASKEFHELMAPVRELIEQGLATAKKQAPFDPHAAYKGWLEYGGRVQLTVIAELADDGELLFWGALAAGSDGHTDLPALCKEIERLALESGQEFAPVTLGGEKWLSRPLGHGIVTLPRMMGEQMMVLLGPDAPDPRLARFFPAQAKPAAAEAPPPIAVTLDVRRALELARAALAQETGEGGRVEKVLAALGLAQCHEVTVSCAPHGPFVDVATTVATPGGRGGLLAIVFPEAAALPALASRAPRAAAQWSVMPVDFAPLLPAIEQMLAEFPEAGLDLAAVEAMVEARAGIRLREDLVGNLGKALLAVSSGTDADAERADLAGIDGLCLALELRDGAAFGRAVETALERAGVLEMRKSEKYRDADVHRITLPLIGIRLHWAVTDRLLLVGLGDAGRNHLGAILDADVASAAGEAPAPLPKGVRERLAAVPEGFASLSVQEFGGVVFDPILAGLRQAESETELPFDVQAVRDVLDGLRALLRKHELDVAASVGYYPRDRWLSRMIW